MINRFLMGVSQRLMLTYRWLGFLSLVSIHGWIFVGAPIMNLLSIGETLIIEIQEGYVSWLSFDDAGAELGSFLIWLGLTYWPIQWILTGNKSLYPWVVNEGEDND